MTATPDQASEILKKGQALFMAGLGMVMGGCLFGGGLAMMFYFLNFRPAAIVAGLLGGLVVLAGIWLQMNGAKLLRSKAS